MEPRGDTANTNPDKNPNSNSNPGLNRIPAADGEKGQIQEQEQEQQQQQTKKDDISTVDDAIAAMRARMKPDPEGKACQLLTWTMTKRHLLIVDAVAERTEKFNDSVDALASLLTTGTKSPKT